MVLPVLFSYLVLMSMNSQYGSFDVCVDASLQFVYTSWSFMYSLLVAEDSRKSNLIFCDRLEKKSTTDMLFVIFVVCWKLYLMPTIGRMDNG